MAILGCYYMQPSFRSIVESKSTVAALHFDVTMPARRINSQWNPQSRTASNAPDGRLIVVHWASIKTTAPSWISACADGEALAGKILPAGSELEIEFFRQARLVVGNAGGVQMVLEGKACGTARARG